MRPSQQFESILEVLPTLLKEKSDLFIDSVADLNSEMTMYIKTIYIGVEIDGAMVAAVYPTKDSLQVVLALDSNHPNKRLEDATHLTWRTMPVMLKVKTVSDFELLTDLMSEASERVATGEHKIDRPAEYFRGRVSRLSHDPKSGKKK
jgi:hypothetical protein